MSVPPIIRPLGESAVVVEFGNVISDDLNDRAIALTEALTSNPFTGFIEACPSYCSTTVFYDLITVRRSFPEFATGFSAVGSFVKNAALNLAIRRSENQPIFDVPVDFSSRHGLDLASVVV